MGSQGIRSGREIAPDFLFHFLPAAVLGTDPHEDLQDLESGGGGLHVLTIPGHLMRIGIQADPVGFQDVGAGKRMMAVETPDPGLQFRRLEWLAQIIMCTCLKAGQLVLQGIPGGQNQDRRLKPGLGSQSAEHLDAIDIGKTQIQNDDIVGLCCGPVQVRPPCPGGIHPDSDILEEIHEGFGQSRVIFHQ